MAKKEILFKLTRKDFVVKPYKASGKGGQRKNKVMSACRISHPPSKAMATASENREYRRNEQAAFRRLLETKEFKIWHKMEVARHTGAMAAAEEAVEQAMNPKNIDVEVKDENGLWVKSDD